MKPRSLLLAIIIAWLVFVVSLAIWWMIFSLKLIDRLNSLVGDQEFARHQQMLFMEGGVLIIMLLMGGCGLIYYSLRERKRFEDIRHFFSTFSHDIKTSITRLVLQGESLTGAEPHSRKFDQFQKNLLILELQLENSMHIAQYHSRGVTLELVDIKQIIGRIHPAWPEVKIQLQGETQFVIDAPAIESILKNLLSNSVIHGGADEVKIKISKNKSAVELLYNDNGRLQADHVEKLGYSLNPSQKGSGIGLYLLRQWAEKLSGKVQFSKTSEDSMQVLLSFPDNVLPGTL